MVAIVSSDQSSIKDAMFAETPGGQNTYGGIPGMNLF